MLSTNYKHVKKQQLCSRFPLVAQSHCILASLMSFADVACTYNWHNQNHFLYCITCEMSYATIIWYKRKNTRLYLWVNSLRMIKERPLSILQKPYQKKGKRIASWDQQKKVKSISNARLQQFLSLQLQNGTKAHINLKVFVLF
jgi:hypothetical protein